MPSNANYKRDYKQEYKTSKTRGEGKQRADTKKARRAAVKAGVAVKGKDMGHTKAAKSGGTTISKKPVNRHANRAAGGRSGSSAGKAAGARKGHASRRKG